MRLRTAACTETSSADTGSSAIEQARRHAQRPREPDPLALPSRELVRKAVAELGAEPDGVEELGDARLQRRAARDPVQAERLADDAARMSSAG